MVVATVRQRKSFPYAAGLVLSPGFDAATLLSLKPRDKESKSR